MSRQAKPLYEFGPFRVDVGERLLLREGQTVPLAPKVFDTLLLLVENRGHLLEKDELMQRLWPDTFVEEANLTNNISLLRRALGDDLGEHRYIETVPRRGYRFIAEVSGLSNGLPELIVEERVRSTITVEQEELSEPTLTGDRRVAKAFEVFASGNKRRRSAILLLVATLVIAVAAFLGYRSWPSQTAPARITSIAVLPFKPLVADSRDESLEMGMTETLITRLSGIREMGVRSMGSVRKYHALEQDPIVAGQEQKVDAVLDGNLQKVGDRVRVTARLIRVRDGHTLWADKFDERLADIFGLQDSISERVAAAMAVKLTGEERLLLIRHHTDNPEAYQLYLKGRLLYRQWTEEAMQKAIECIDRAISIDHNYALAYAGKADVYSANSSVFLLPAEAMPKAREAAQKALSIDDQLPEGHRSMALVKLWADWDLAGAEQEFIRALETKPNDAEARASYGGLLISLKRFDEALAESKRALELDPISLMISYTAGRNLFFAREYDQALEHCRDALALHPNSADLHRALGCVLREKKMYEEAIVELRKAVDLRRQDSILSDLAHTYALAGRTNEARKLVKELGGLSKRRYVSPVSIAKIYAGLGENGLAFRWLEKGYTDRSDHLLILGVDPSFDGIRSDSRFPILLKRVGLVG